MKLFNGSKKKRSSQQPQSNGGYAAAPSNNRQFIGNGANGVAQQPRPTSKKKPKKRVRRKKRFLNEQMADVQLPLVLADSNHQPWMTFTSDVVDNLRNMVTKIGRKEAIPERIALVSALPGEGVTYMARALATVMANDLAARVCLVDLNWWSPASPPIETHRNNGLVSVVTGKRRLDEVFVQTSLPNLTIIPAGPLERAERPVMARSNVLKSAIDVLGRYFDHLIIDVPSVRATNDSVPLASLSNGVCFVMQQGITPVETVRLALDELEHLNVLGVLMNRVEFTAPESLLRFIPQD